MASKDTKDGVVLFRALKLINEHRNAYGLRYNDYERYRNHCKNRTHRLRSTLKMTHGKGREFKKLPSVSLENTKSGHLQLLLFEAERAWAHAQELYTSSLALRSKPTDDTSASAASTLRHSATNRFRRALHWSAQLLALAQALHAAARLPAAHMLELGAYTSLLSGRFLLFRESFQEALGMLCAGHTLLKTLEGLAGTSRDLALVRFFLDGAAPEIRYCAHQMKVREAHDVERIAGEVGPGAVKGVVADFEGVVRKAEEARAGRKADAERGKLREMEWEGAKVGVRIPELVDVLLKVQKAEEQLQPKDGQKAKDEQAGGSGKRQRKGVAAFDAVLAALSDAEDVARKLAEAQKTTGSASSAGPGEHDIHFLHAYIVYQLLSRRIERDLTLVSALFESAKGKKSTKKAATEQATDDADTFDARVNPAVVKLLDTVLQSLTAMRSLAVVDESPDIANGIELRMAYTRAQRCLYLSRSYGVDKQYAKVVLLLRRATTCIRESETFLPSSSSPSSPHLAFFPVATDAFTSLASQIEKDEKKSKEEWFAYNGGQVTEGRDSSKKPLHFDIALNYVQLDLESLYRRAGLQPPPESAGSAGGAGGAGSEGKASGGGKTREDVVARAETPEPAAANAAESSKGGLSALLGGWWGRK